MNIDKLINGMDLTYGVFWSESQEAFQVKRIGEERILTIAAYIKKHPLPDYRLMGVFETQKQADQFIQIVGLRRLKPNS